jgi:hypothetical protein
VTLGSAARFLSIRRGPIEPKSWAVHAPRWRVTPRTRCPRIRAILLVSSNGYEPKVARDRPRSDGVRGALAAGADRRPGTAPASFDGGASRASGNAPSGTPLRRLAASSPPSPPAGTTDDIPCTASLLLAPSRLQRRLLSGRRASRAVFPGLRLRAQRQLAPWAPVTSAGMALRRVGGDRTGTVSSALVASDYASRRAQSPWGTRSCPTTFGARTSKGTFLAETVFDATRSPSPMQ